MISRHEHIVAGYDGSPGAVAAVSWAASEAIRRRCGLTVIGCYTTPMISDYGMSAAAALVTADMEAVRLRTQQSVAEIVEQLRERHGDLMVNGVAIHGSPRRVLPEQSEKADLLVVGSSGTGTTAGLLLGSVAFGVVHAAPCPVVIVPPARDDARHGRVVVGVRTLESSCEALEWAVDEADLIGAQVTVVHAWSYPYEPDVPASAGRDIVQVDAARELDRAVQHGRARAGVSVEGLLVGDDAADALNAAAAAGDLVVVGSRGRGTVRSLLLGSVSLAVIAGSGRPTVVVHQHDH